MPVFAVGFGRLPGKQLAREEGAFFLSIRIIADVFDLDLAASPKMVMLVLADHADDTEGFAWPSQETIARKAGLSERCVRAKLGELSDLGWIRRVTEPGPRGTRCSYYLNLPRIEAEAQAARAAIREHRHEEAEQARLWRESHSFVAKPPDIAAEPAAPRSADPSVDPSYEPSDDPAAAAAARDANFRTLCDAWTNATGQTVPRVQGEMMKAAADDVGLQWVLDAITETALGGARRWSYTRAILDRWTLDGREPKDGIAAFDEAREAESALEARKRKFGVSS